MSDDKFPIAVLASGSGTNFQNLVDRSREGELPIEVRLLISDKPESGALKRARRLGVDTFLAARADFETRQAMDQAIGEALDDSGAELVVLAGYMRVLGPELVRAWRHKMINLHPSLLPSFRGLDGLGQALEAGVKVTGATVHIVDEGLDTGPIVAQEAFAVPEGASRTEVEQILYPIEHDLVARAVRYFAEGRVRCDGKCVQILDEPTNNQGAETAQITEGQGNG